MVRVGVIGVGYLGRLHAQKFASMPDVRLIGVHDTDPARGRAVAQEAGTAFFESRAGLLREVEAVSIAVPTTAHCDVALDALRAGVHVLIEKPLAATIAQGRVIVREAARRGRVLQVGHVERFNPAVSAAAAVVREPRFIECHRLGSFGGRGTDVDVVLDLMIHDLDLILSFVRSPIRGVQAVGVPVVSSTVDIANARIAFANGCVANVTASRVSARKQRKIRIFQEDAYVSMDFVERRIQILRRVVPEGGGPAQLMGELLEAGGGDALYDEMASFVACVRSKGAPRVTGEDGLAALSAAFRILKGMRRR